MKKRRAGLGLYVVLIMIVACIWYAMSNPTTATYTASQFTKVLEKGEIQSAVIRQNEQVPTGSVRITTTAGGTFVMNVSDVGQLQDTLDDMIELLNEDGRICIITFHSLEDRIVKTIFKNKENPITCPSNLPVCK